MTKDREILTTEPERSLVRLATPYLEVERRSLSAEPGSQELAQLDAVRRGFGPRRFERRAAT